MKYFPHTFIFLTLLTTPLTAFGEQFIPLVPLPTIAGFEGGYESLEGYINLLFYISIAVGAIIAVIQLIRAGFMYMLSEALPQLKNAREIIFGAVAGLLLLLGAVVIFQTITPQITNLSGLQFGNLGPTEQEIQDILNTQDILKNTQENEKILEENSNIFGAVSIPQALIQTRPGLVSYYTETRCKPGNYARRTQDFFNNENVVLTCWPVPGGDLKPTQSRTFTCTELGRNCPDREPLIESCRINNGVPQVQEAANNDVSTTTGTVMCVPKTN